MKDFYTELQSALFQALNNGHLPVFQKSLAYVQQGYAHIGVRHHKDPYPLGISVHVRAAHATTQDLHDGIIQGGWFSPAAAWCASVTEEGYQVRAGSGCVLLGHRVHKGASYSLERARDFHDRPSARFIQNLQIFNRKDAYRE